MVQTDISQLSAECSEWRQILRNYRNEFHDYEKALEASCKHVRSRNEQLEVEHFQNQFDIQLKNIHDLKQRIKVHERKAQLDTAIENAGDSPYVEHEHLLNDFLNLENMLQEVRIEFKDFVNKVRC